MISADLLEIICCPLTKADLVLENNALVSTDEKTRLRYKIVDDIPVLLVEEAEEVPLEEWRKIMKKHDRLK